MANEKQVINEKLMGKLMAINVEDYSAHLTSMRSQHKYKRIIIV